MVSFVAVEYVDTEYSLWLTWFLTPVIVTFLLPAVIIVLIYLSSIIFHLYRLYRLRVVGGVHGDWRHAARLAVCALWDAHGWLWHGYDICGLENIPDGPFLVIYYHGALPIDMYYFIARMMLFKRRHIHTVADRFLFKIPGWRSLLELLCVIPGTVQECAAVLKSGNPLAISPGGVYEAQFGDHDYRLYWKSRIGFAKPIVPMFTQNVREAFRTVGWLRGVCLRLYSATRIPLTPVYGGFPVKLVASAIEELVLEHQRVPGNILLALVERVLELPKPRKHKKHPETNGNCRNGACYDICGLENIPDGPFLVIYYHGALPIDMYYFIARMMLFKRRHIHTVADRFLFKIPGWRSLLELLCVIPGTVQECAAVLKSGNPLAISPGGVYEAQFGDHDYRLYWKSRIGFAKPIVPMFTQNVREAFRTVGWLRGVCLRLYSATRIPLTPVYGGFPVKLVASAIEELVLEHQRVPGNILLALVERVLELPKPRKHKKHPETNGNCRNGACKNGKIKTEDSLNEKCDKDKTKVS
ncbi:unnamed protein product [Leptidea sinapis]|uniref:Phospholipid/glycerol acyltransferase domain-containing protein n=1 Tax=Leptidea sinapis TaxID=189913 RepID=A0A5E4R0R1_9NEOP|nr:unnamed protein product [Leptidea sinapis]